MHIQDLNLVITVPADTLPPDSDRINIGDYKDMFAKNISGHGWFCVIIRADDVIQPWSTKFGGTSRVKRHLSLTSNKLGDG